MDGGTLTQIRVHELAKELKISTMALKTHLNALGVITKSHMSFIDDEIADKIRLKYNEQINAEKKAEKDRKHFIEMKHQAAVKAKHDAEAALHPHVIEVVPEIEEEESDEQFSEAQQPTVEQPVTQHSVPSKKREETPPRDIRTPYQQYKPTPRPAAGQSQDRGQYRDRPQGQGSGQTSGQGQYRDRPQGQYQVQNTNSGQSRPYNNAQRPSDSRRLQG
jgi:hypothetical protein